MTKRTPTPWNWIIHDSSAASLEGPQDMLDHVLTVSPCKHCRGEEWQWGACTNPTRENADFLVKAVNAHDALVKALEEIEDLGANGATAARLGNIAHAALIAVRLNGAVSGASKP